MLQLPTSAAQQQQVRQEIGNLRIQTASRILCATLSGMQQCHEMMASESFFKESETPQQLLQRARAAAGHAVLYADCLLSARGLC